jgi:hypothetical protein
MSIESLTECKFCVKQEIVVKQKSAEPEGRLDRPTK